MTHVKCSCLCCLLKVFTMKNSRFCFLQQVLHIDYLISLQLLFCSSQRSHSSILLAIGRKRVMLTAQTQIVNFCDEQHVQSPTTKPRNTRKGHGGRILQTKSKKGDGCCVGLSNAWRNIIDGYVRIKHWGKELFQLIAFSRVNKKTFLLTFKSPVTPISTV